MSNRAIRNNQLNFDPMNKDKYAFFKDIHANLNPAKDITVWNFLQEATQHNVEIGICNEKGFRRLTPQEVKDYLANIA